MIRHPALGARRALSAYADNARRAVKKGAGSRGLADLWLEFSFGLKPLLNDVKSGAEALGKLGTNFRMFRASALAEAPDVVDSSTNLNGWASVKTYQGWTDVTTSTARGTGAFRTKPSIFCQADLNVLGVSWGDALLTGYELIPYSFLVDYFTSVGDCLNAQILLGQVDTVYACVSTKSTVTRTWLEKVGDANSSFYYVIDNPPALVKETFRFERFKVSGKSVPFPRFTFAQKLNSNRLFNIAALARMRFP